jgi:hypothetical protein
MNAIYTHQIPKTNGLRLSLNSERVFSSEPVSRSNFYVRIVQSDPLYPDAHEQFPGAEHVPPFEQTGTHTAKSNTNMNNIYSRLLCRNKWTETLTQ